MLYNNESKIVAITGPSGVGKTTLGNYLIERNEFITPRHCTTRSPRSDDQAGFYRYLSHENYRFLVEEKKFLLTSGDGPVVSKEYGNFYGILKDDINCVLTMASGVLLFVSYKDIERLAYLASTGYDINIVNLTFSDIENGVRIRLMSNPERDHSKQDIESRIFWAKKDAFDYEDLLKRYADTNVYTDLLGKEETYERVCTDLGLSLKKVR